MGRFRFMMLFGNDQSWSHSSVSRGFRHLFVGFFLFSKAFVGVGLSAVYASSDVAPKANFASTAHITYLPSGNDELMFYVQRNVDDRRVHYVLNTNKNGRLNVRDPFQIFWVNSDASANKSTSKLNLIQRRLVYGVRVQAVEHERVDFSLAAYPDITLSLIPKNGHYQVFTTINGMFCRLQYIHVELADKNIYNPTVRYVKLVGVDKQGRRVTEDIVE